MGSRMVLLYWCAVAIMCAVLRRVKAVSELRINFGGESVGSFDSDQNVVYLTPEKFLFSAQAIPPASSKQLKTGDIQVYWSQRASTNGALDFVVPNLDPGIYDLKLLFAENYRKVNTAGQRLLRVQISACENETASDDFDIFHRAGNQINAGVVMTHAGIRVLDHVRITITSKKLTPVLNGLVMHKSANQNAKSLPTTDTCPNAAFGKVDQSQTPKVSAVRRDASFDAVLRQTCINDEDMCHCVGTPMPPEAQCLNVFNGDTVPNVCEYSQCETRYACDCSGSILCRKRLLRSEAVVVGTEGLADGFAYCVRQTLQKPKSSVIPLIGA
ncbi:hypothetical protein FVE85_2155 [Porphyridium purpureum]|uniref:Malectin domain-containing protein n=1 Tax=Porphyridium purpureum TaxID=35688 RepID=A0A5J4YYE8_PORPP|nr:hypothetical protein FVE85_2155 [Porphyridium purpureum]|eukprot:POR3287..scf209_3